MEAAQPVAPRRPARRAAAGRARPSSAPSTPGRRASARRARRRASRSTRRPRRRRARARRRRSRAPRRPPRWLRPKRRRSRAAVAASGSGMVKRRSPPPACARHCSPRQHAERGHARRSSTVRRSVVASSVMAALRVFIEATLTTSRAVDVAMVATSQRRLARSVAPVATRSTMPSDEAGGRRQLHRAVQPDQLGAVAALGEEPPRRLRVLGGDAQRRRPAARRQRRTLRGGEHQPADAEAQVGDLVQLAARLPEHVLADDAAVAGAHLDVHGHVGGPHGDHLVVAGVELEAALEGLGAQLGGDARTRAAGRRRRRAARRSAPRCAARRRRAAAVTSRRRRDGVVAAVGVHDEPGGRLAQPEPLEQRVVAAAGAEREADVAAEQLEGGTGVVVPVADRAEVEVHAVLEAALAQQLPEPGELVERAQRALRRRARRGPGRAARGRRAAPGSAAAARARPAPSAVPGEGALDGHEVARGQRGADLARGWRRRPRRRREGRAGRRRGRRPPGCRAPRRRRPRRSPGRCTRRRRRGRRRRPARSPPAWPRGGARRAACGCAPPGPA